jgi:uncharacterized Zn-finger protein
MAFQFQCPQGHLLEADESQAAQQCQCPMCGVMFVIPAPPGASPFGISPYSTVPTLDPTSPVEPPSFPFAPTATPGAGFDPFNQPAQPRFLHIPCPRGDELEVPLEMVGQEVICPHCQTQFRLRDKDSIEHKQKRRQELELKDYKTGQLWMTWAVVIAVAVLIGLAVMIGLSASQ